jgi:hypothetical protein
MVKLPVPVPFKEKYKDLKIILYGCVPVPVYIFF